MYKMFHNQKEAGYLFAIFLLYCMPGPKCKGLVEVSQENKIDGKEK
jgi:hypothetical protein